MVLELWPDQRDRAVRLAKKPGAVRIESDGTRADVASFSQPDLKHTVARAGTAWLCDCDFFVATGIQCAHAVAVRYVLTVEAAPVTMSQKVERADGSVFYRQNWRAYDAAQTGEVYLFDALLADLCSTIPEPLYPGNGRPPAPLREQAFCAVQKVYSQLSCRRAKSLFDRAAERGELSHAPSYPVASRFLNRPDATTILTDLIHQSAAPLAALEHSFAVDSTGFRTTGFGPYCQDKHGEKKKHQFVKAHAICGVKTNIVTSIRVTQSHGKGSADTVNLPALVEATAQNFTVHEVSADKAYSGKANLWHIHHAGATPLIPFREGQAGVNHGGRSSAYQNAAGFPGSAKMWRKAHHYFEAHRDEFDARYHKRSNVEATFGAIKKKFGDAVKSKNEVAQRNEVLAKVLAHNLTVLIKASHVLGIDLGAIGTAPASPSQ